MPRRAQDVGTDVQTRLVKHGNLIQTGGTPRGGRYGDETVPRKDKSKRKARTRGEDVMHVVQYN